MDSVLGRQESSQLEEDEDASCLQRGHSPLTHLYDYHICYQKAFSVPALYFRGYHASGEPLPWADIVAHLPSEYR